ncbi:MAG: methionyl-tRNA formyltransferase [Lachnospiraceae bacterium]
MKVIFMGTPDFSTGVLESIIEAGHEVTAVVTQPDKPKGRGHEMQFTPVKEVALKYDLPVLQPKKIRDPEVVERLREIPADICVVVAFGQIIPQEILDMKKYGCINVHASLLPAYRGAAPIQWAVVDGLKETGVTIMQMDAGLDTGDMLTKVTVPLDEKETGGSLFDKLSAAGARLCVETMELIEKGEVTPEKQGETTTKYAGIITKDLGKIDFSKSAAEIERMIRGFNPWPSAYTRLGNKQLKIWAADVLEEEYEGAFGEIVKVTGTEICVKTGKGTLAVRELQLEGKKRMLTDAFLRGFSLKNGVLLG